MVEQVVWTAPDGTVLNLTDDAAGFRVLADGTRGLRSVTYEMVTSKYATVDGETVDAIRAEANQPSLGMLVQANTDADFQARARALVRAMRPKVGPGELRVSLADGTVRRLSCYCSGGLEGDEAPDATLAGSWWKLLLKFYAPDPWWYGDEETTGDISLTSAGAGNFFPIPPVTLSASTVAGEFQVDLSDSDDRAFPQWVITGPGSSLSLVNATTGRVISINAALGVGETMIIDTRPGFQSVRRADGTNLMGTVDSDPALWPLEASVNVVSASMTGATSASRIVGVWRPRYAGI